MYYADYEISTDSGKDQKLDDELVYDIINRPKDIHVTVNVPDGQGSQWFYLMVNFIRQAGVEYIIQ